MQWDIMSKAFDAEGKTLVLIGDPKQAIYAFRGADVHTYLKAKATVQSKWTLDVNWRSDKGLLAAYDALFQGAQLGQAGITYRNVRAAPPNAEPRLLRAPVSTPLRVRVVHTADGFLPTYQQKVKAPEPRDLIARDLAAQTVQLLEAEPEITTLHHDGTKAAHCTPVTSPCWSGPTGRRRRCVTPSSRRTFLRSSVEPGLCSAQVRLVNGSASSRRSSSPRRALGRRWRP